MTPEGRVKRDVKRWLTARGIFFFSPIGGPYSAHGVSDIIGCHRGRFVAIECKAPGKRHTTTENQKLFLARVHDSGGIAAVIDDASQLEELFRDHRA